MKFLTNTQDYNKNITVAKELNGVYTKPVIFHCYWNGILNEKHLYSILSFHYFNINNNNNKIILWLENNTSNNYNIEIEKYAEIKYFSMDTEIKNTFLENYSYDFTTVYFKSDYIRCILLYNYGGCWFDLDCLCLRNFDPIFKTYEDNICLYQWACSSRPNNAIYISLYVKSDKMKKNMEYIMERNKGWGCYQADLNSNLPLDILILPCSWFDAGWIKTPYSKPESFIHIFNTVEQEINFDNFFNGAFCYHWHNKWHMKIQDNSPLLQLINIIKLSYKNT